MLKVIFYIRFLGPSKVDDIAQGSNSRNCYSLMFDVIGNWQYQKVLAWCQQYQKFRCLNYRVIVYWLSGNLIQYM